MGEMQYPLVRDDPDGGVRHVVGMQELMSAVPDLGWLMTPAGLVAFVLVLGLIMSGFVGRIVLYVDNLVNSFDLEDPAPAESLVPVRVNREDS